MTPLNTIIEEEKGRFETVFGETLGLDEPFNNSYVLLHVKPMLKNFLTTAIQRAYEAGEREADAKWEREVEGMRKDCPHDSRSHCLEEECWIHEDGGYNQAIDTLLSKIRS